MGAYELGSDDRKVVMIPNPRRAVLAARGDYRFATTPERIPAPKSPAGTSSVQVHRALSARANRTLGDDGQLEGFSLKGIVKGIGKAVKAVAKPATSLALNFVPGGGFVKSAAGLAQRALNRPAAPPPPPPPPPLAVAAPPAAVRRTPFSPRPVPLPPKTTPTRIAPDMVLPGSTTGTALAVMTPTEAALTKQLADAKAGALTAKKAHDLAQAAKKQSVSLRDRANKLAGNARAASAKAAAAAAAGDAAGADKFAEIARTIQALATNTAAAATSAGNYVERAGNAVAAGTDAAIVAGATNSETAGGIFAKIQANPLLAAGGAATIAFLAYKAFGGRSTSRRAA